MRKSLQSHFGSDINGGSEWNGIEEGVFSDAHKKKIVVVGIGSGSGATFVSANLAYHLAKFTDGVCYVEADCDRNGNFGGKYAAVHGADGGAYRSIPLDRVIAEKRAIDYFEEERRGGHCGNRRNLYANVNWAVHLPATAAAGKTAVAGTASQMRGRGGGTFGIWESTAAQVQRNSQQDKCRDTGYGASFGAECSFGREYTSEHECSSGKEYEAAWSRKDEGIFACENPTDYIRSDSFVYGSESDRRRHFVPPLAAARGFIGNEAPCSASDGLRLERIPGRYLVLDNPPIARLREAELVICVVDPLPSRLSAGSELLECLRENRIIINGHKSPVLNLPTPVLWVLNKDNSRVSHRELESRKKIRFDFSIPLLDERIFYRAEYSGVPIFKLLDSAESVREGSASPDTKKAVRAEFERLAKYVLQELL